MQEGEVYALYGISASGLETEPGVKARTNLQCSPTNTVSNAHDWPHDLVSKCIDHEQQIPGVIEIRCCTQKSLELSIASNPVKD